MKKILAFRTDRLGDFIITKQSLNIFLANKNKYEVDFVVSKKNYNYIKNFKSIKNIYIFEGSYLNFFIKNYDILKKKYDYLILYDGKKRSHIISFFLKGKKISLSKSKGLYKIAKFFGYKSIFNSDYLEQSENFNFVNLLLGQKNFNKKIDFYFDYEFKKIDLNLPFHKKEYLILHLDEKWFREYYYHDFDYCNWEKEFFYNLINLLLDKYKLPIIITTGPIKIPFFNQILSDFNKIEKNFFNHKNYKNNLFIIDNLSFRELETLLKLYAAKLLCCEGGISHVSNNLNIETIALVQGKREIFYRHWTGHMKNIHLILRSSSNREILTYIKNV